METEVYEQELTVDAYLFGGDGNGTQVACRVGDSSGIDADVWPLTVASDAVVDCLQLADPTASVRCVGDVQALGAVFSACE